MLRSRERWWPDHLNFSTCVVIKRRRDIEGTEKKTIYQNYLRHCIHVFPAKPVFDSIGGGNSEFQTKFLDCG